MDRVLISQLAEYASRATGLTPTVCAPFASTGLSNSSIVKIECGETSYCARSWGQSENRAHAIVENWEAAWHAMESFRAASSLTRNPFPRIIRWNDSTASLSGCSPSPALIALAGTYWSLAEWIGGQPATVPVTLESATRYVEFLAQVHAGTQSIHRCHQRSVTLSQRARLASVFRTSPLEAQLKRWVDSLDRSESARLQLFLRSVREIESQLGDWEMRLSHAATIPRACHWIVRDVWRENLLIDRAGNAIGIVDFGASQIDWPGLDVIRLVGSIGSPSQSRFHGLIEDYCRRFSEHAIDAIEECYSLHRMALGLSILQWGVWMIQGTFSRQAAEGWKRALDRMAELCDQWAAEWTMGSVT